jgi:hypothetical protein
MVKHREIVLSVRFSTVPKEITHQRESAEAFDVSGNRQREKRHRRTIVQLAIVLARALGPEY